MRLIYLCAVDPPPPSSDWPAVQNFFKALPEYLHPKDRDNNSSHTLLFADRIGNNWLPEFYDFAIVFLSETFLSNETALKCLERAKYAFPNMVCIDLYNNLTQKSREFSNNYAKRLFTTDEGKEFLLTSFPQIAASYDLETERLTKSIETDGYRFLTDTIDKLHKREKRNKIISWGCYGLSFSYLIAMLVLSLQYLLNITKITEQKINYDLTVVIVIGIEAIILSAIIISIARFLFLLGKSLMVESIRNADRAHAIGLGRLYLQLYKEKFKWEELKDVLKNWNIDSGSAFIDLDAKDIEPVKLDHVLSPFK